MATFPLVSLNNAPPAIADKSSLFVSHCTISPILSSLFDALTIVLITMSDTPGSPCMPWGP